MPATVRKAVLSFHILASVGWMGAVLAFIVLDVATVARTDAAVVRAAYIAMDLVAKWAIVPSAAAALVSGIVLSLVTRWGLFRHYWVVASLVLTVLATVVLLVQLPAIALRAALAADPSVPDASILGAGNMLLHSVGGFVVLTGVALLNVYKPRGLTPYGWRKERSRAGGNGQA